MRNKSMNILTLLTLSIIIWSGCTSTPLYNVKDSNMPPAAVGKELKLDDVTRAIVQAGTGLGWDMRVAKPGQIVGTLRLRSHTAVVDIPYTTSSYSIIYNSSQKLNYDAEKNQIHRNYNGWVQNLDKAIRNRLTGMGA
jgi:hypothetical protein